VYNEVDRGTTFEVYLPWADFRTPDTLPVLSTIAAVLLAFHPQPLALDNLGLDRTRTLDGQRVFVSILVGKPPQYREWCNSRSCR
jgi:hypothetical protein